MVVVVFVVVCDGGFVGVDCECVWMEVVDVEVL